MVVSAEGYFAEIKQCGGKVGVEFEDSVELFFCAADAAVFEQEDTKVEDYIGVAGVGSQLLKEMGLCELRVAVCPVGLGDSVVDLWVGRL